ncbi:hypothetical protein CWB41_13450 [Methylovirgula ligni]|nr:hypothetical protein CWB41_13450 [Methylovirgula ligni]
MILAGLAYALRPADGTGFKSMDFFGHLSNRARDLVMRWAFLRLRALAGAHEINWQMAVRVISAGRPSQCA